MAILQNISSRLEALSMRERVLLLVGAPALLVFLAEALLFGPARQRTVAAQQQIQLQQGELKALTELLASQPTLAVLPAVDQLQRQRDEILRQIDDSGKLAAGLSETVDWGTVVRGAVTGTPGLMLTQLKTQPAEELFSQAKAIQSANNSRKPKDVVKAAAAAVAASAPALTAIPAANGVSSVYRHKAELTLQGDFGALLTYLRTLQQVPGALHWERLQLTVNEYPRATVQLTLYTLSDRAQTPFN